MILSDIKAFVSSIAVIATVLQFLSGILVCKQYMKNRTTAESSPLPFICGEMACGIWLLYGMVKMDNTIIFVNFIGMSLMSMYIIVFYCYTFKKSSFLKQIIAMTLFMFFVLGYVYFEADNELLVGRIGLLACSLTLLTVGAPLSKLFYVVKVKCTDCLPFPMIVMSFIVSALWFLYGLIEEDVYMTTPNVIGGALAMFQLSFFLIYPNKQSSSPESSKSMFA